MLRGAIAAAVTPLADGGEVLDEDGVDALVAFLAGGGLDGVLALGTTGEGILLAPDERRRAAELAAHAADAGADAVAVIAPPYFALDARSLVAHFEAAAQACEPLPFYVYEFEARSGYAVPLSVLERLRERAPNLAGLKVSDSPWTAVAPYLVEGLDLFVGAEALVHEALAQPPELAGVGPALVHGTSDHFRKGSRKA